MAMSGAAMFVENSPAYVPAADLSVAGMTVTRPVQIG